MRDGQRDGRRIVGRRAWDECGAVDGGRPGRTRYGIASLLGDGWSAMAGRLGTEGWAVYGGRAGRRGCRRRTLLGNGRRAIAGRLGSEVGAVDSRRFGPGQVIAGRRPGLGRQGCRRATGTVEAVESATSWEAEVWAGMQD